MSIFCNCRGTSRLWLPVRLVWSVVKYVSPWMLFVGIAAAVSGLVVWPFLLLIEHLKTPSNALFSVIVLAGPGAVVLGGVVLAILGFAIQCGARREAAGTWLPPLDWRRPAFRRVVLSCFVFCVIAGSVAVYNAIALVEFTESTEFCAELCHITMDPEGITHALGPHANATCGNCHVGPGVPHYLRTKILGMWELTSLVFNLYERPLHMPREAMRSTEVICGQCHWEDKSHGQVLKNYTYFLPDEANTRHNLSMLLNVGSLDHDGGASATIHGHSRPDHVMSYLATDERNETIPYVKVVHADGGEDVYVDPNAEVAPAELLAAGHDLKQVDCLTCHSRPAHSVRSPQVTVNAALAAGRIDPALPSIKAKALEVLTEEYETTEAALEGIQETLTAFYTAKYPEVVKAGDDRLTKAVDAIQTIYRTSIFPRMKTDWRSNPDHIGHFSSPGCFRCHDGQHATAAGKVIRNDCALCHDIVAQGQGEGAPDIAGGQSFEHPEDIGEAWMEMPCTDCHAGAGAGL